ncbi:ribosomal RNA processing protein 1 homolog B [Tiliqua scincoides]|uniref:ribosomal RNA processing protein 1 homolog B n=1 Tax=Tiliqua scincoides TaxID=71010 RepID=UPI003461DBD7
MAPAAAVAQPPEIQFAQRLAANEKKIRDRALRKLRGYIALRTRSPAGGFSEEELLKIWKGLFYCMWMQDKPLLQEELSNNISQLIHIFDDMETRHLFIQTFWQTMNREWNGIDRLRLDKFYTLIRMMLRQSFEVLKRNGWNESFTDPFLYLLMKEVIHSDSKSPVGIKLHFIDIYLEELAKVGAKELTADQNLKFIDPFCKIVAKTKDHFLLQAIIHGIFETIVDQSPFAIEDLMNELKADSDDDFSDEEWSDEESKLIAKDKNLSSKSSTGSEAQEGLQEDIDYNIGPVLQFDYKMVADGLFELASRKNTPVYNRKHIYKVIKKFQDLAEGTFPQDDFPEDVSTDEDDDTFSRGKWKRKSDKLLKKTKLEKESSTNKQNGVEKDDANTGLQKKRKKRKKKSRPMMDSCAAAGSNEKEPVEVVESKDLNHNSELPNTKKKQKKCLTVEANKIASANPISELGETDVSKSLTCLVRKLKKQPKKKNCSLQKVHIETIHQNGQADTSTEDDPGYGAPVEHDSKVMKKKWKVESGLVTGNGFSEETVKQPERESLAESESVAVRKVKLKQKHKLRNVEKNSVSRQKIVSMKKKRKLKEVLNPVEESELAAENKKSKNDETIGTVPLLKKKIVKAGNDFVKFEKTSLPKPAFFRKAKGSTTSMQLSKLQSSNSKKVTFGLNKNMTAEFKKTDKSILVSPEGPSRVAFNPEQKPPHGVLKLSLGSPAGTPQSQKSSLMPAKKRPTAMDFF